MKVLHLAKRWWFWALLCLAVVVVIVLKTGGEKVSYVTESVQQGMLLQTVDASGEVVSINEADLSFDIGGELEKIFVSVGEEVQAGTVLASLKTKELEADVANAYQALQVARANLKQQNAGSKNETINVSTAGVQSAQASFDLAERDAEHALIIVELIEARYQADVDVKQTALSSAHDDLAQTQTDHARKLNEAYRDLFSASWGAVVTARAGFTQADDVLGVRNGSANDAYATNMSVRDPVALVRAREVFGRAESSLFTAESIVASSGYASSHSSLVQVASSVQQAIDRLAILLLYTKQVVDATVTDSNFTVADHSALKTTVNTIRASVQADQETLENARQAVDAEQDTGQADVSDARNAVRLAENSLASAEALADEQTRSAQRSVDSAQANVQIKRAEIDRAVASLSEVKAVPRQVDLASFEAEVARATAAHRSAQARLDKAQIVSPIAGNVTDVLFEVGETLTPGTPTVVVQTTSAQFKIVLNVSESDIVTLDIGDPVRMTFDAFSDDMELIGTVGEINPAEKLIEGVVYYQATIYLNDSSVVALRPGLSADAVIETDRRDGVVMIPQRAFFSRDGNKYARVLVNGTPQEREIVTGLRGDLGRMEVLSGLAPGEDLIVREIHE
jgi:multidrug efflux pump subunit AcrA (membrane-fusion protein)